MNASAWLLLAAAASEPAAAGIDEPPAHASRPEPGAPETTEPDDAPAAGPWVLGAFIDTSYQSSSNRPDNHVWRGMFTSPRTDEISVNLAALWVRRDAGTRDPFHFELAVQAGPAADALVSGEPTPGGTDSRFAGPETWKHLARANAGLSFDTGTDVSAGLLVCPIGLGMFWTPMNWHYSTPWALNAVPYYLLGGRVRQKLGKMVELQAWVVNGWQTMADVNDVPSYLAAVVLTPRDDVTIQQVGYFGPEDADVSLRGWRAFSNTQVTWNVERVGVAAHLDIGRERLTTTPDEPVALWLATAADVRWRILGERHTWDMAARGGGYWDRDGRMFGVRQWLIEAVYTNDVRLLDHLLVRLEYRYDRSTARDGFFYRQRATSDASPWLARDQHTVIAAVAGYFELGLARTRPRG